jgi:hypothetical protein
VAFFLGRFAGINLEMPKIGGGKMRRRGGGTINPNTCPSP